MRKPLVLALLLALPGCSRTTPDTQWPPPGPTGGVPVIPMPEEGLFGNAEEEPEPEAPKGPAPIDAALPESPPSALARSAKCTEKNCQLKAFLPDAAFSKATPGGEASPAALWMQHIAEGSALTIPRHSHLEVLAVGISGKALVTGDDGGAPQDLATWHTLRAAGGGVNLTAHGGAAEVLVAVVATKGTLDEAMEHAKAKPWEVRWKKRPAAIARGDLGAAKDLAWGGGAFHARIALGGADGVLPASLGTLTASPAGNVPEHDHPGWESIAILSGKGTLKIGDKSHPVAPGKVFHIPAKTPHAFNAAGDTELLAVQIYSPSGPEQRFIGLADAEAKGGAKPAAKP